MSDAIRYFIFDVESVADGELVRKVRYPGEELSDSEATAKYREEFSRMHRRCKWCCGASW